MRFSVVICGQDMLRRCMQETFTDASTLGIVMGDTNIGCAMIPQVISQGNIGVIQDCDHHPKRPNFEWGKCRFVTGDYVFAGDATTTPIKCEKLVGLDFEHVAILAKVTFHGPPAASASTPGVTVSPDIQPQGVAQAGALLRR